MAKRRNVREAARARLNDSEVAAKAEVASAAEAPTAKAAATYAEVPLAAVAPNRHNPRKDVGDLDELVASIREVGVLQPIVVRPLGKDEKEHYPAGTRYVLVMGERRWTASQEAGMETVPALVRTDEAFVDGERQKMLIENLHRQALSPVEEATAYAELVEEGLSQRALATQVGKTQAHVSRRLSLLQMHPTLVQWVVAGRLSVDAATKKIAPEIDRAHQDVLVEHMERLDRVDQLDQTSDGVISAAAVSRAVSYARGQQDKDAERARQVALVEAAGGTVIDDPDEVDQPLDRLHQVGEVEDSPEKVKASAGDRDLYAVVDVYGKAPRWYVPVELDEEDGQTQQPAAPTKKAETAESAEARDRRRWKEIREGVAQWVAASITQRPRKTELADEFARFIVSGGSHDYLQMVNKWMVAGSVGPEESEVWAWQRAVLDEGSPDVILTAAWLVTVAAETYGARYSLADSPAAKITAERIAAVKGDQS